MTPEEKEQRLEVLSQRMRAIGQNFILYDKALPMGMGRSTEFPDTYCSFSYEEKQTIRGEEFVFLVVKTQRVTKAELLSTPDNFFNEEMLENCADEQPFDFYIARIDPFINGCETRTEMLEFLAARTEPEFFEFAEENLLQVARKVNGHYEEFFKKLPYGSQVLSSKIITILRKEKKLEKRLKIERKRKIDAEIRLFDLQNDARTASQDLAATRTFVRSGAIGKIRENLERAVNGSQIDKKHPPWSDRPNPAV